MAKIQFYSNKQVGDKKIPCSVNLVMNKKYIV
jgi:hypothetical protein